SKRDWSSDVCSSDLPAAGAFQIAKRMRLEDIRRFDARGSRLERKRVWQRRLPRVAPHRPYAIVVTAREHVHAQHVTPPAGPVLRSEEHTSELQSRFD